MSSPVNPTRSRFEADTCPNLVILVSIHAHIFRQRIFLRFLFFLLPLPASSLIPILVNTLVFMKIVRCSEVQRGAAR
jgi:hypothetical protein